MVDTVLYRYGLKEAYLALEAPDINTLYWCTDTQELYKGNLLFAVGKEASSSAAGLLSAADKAKLDALTGAPLNFKGVYDSLDDIDFLPIDGDMVIVGSKEYIYSDYEWKEFGDEGSYLTKTEAEATYETIAEVDKVRQTLNNKVDRLITNADGSQSLIFNESDGGGAMYAHSDGSQAYVGVNNGGLDGMMAQIYADVQKEDGSWVGSRINVFHDKIYYTNLAAKEAGTANNDSNHEIATKGDIIEATSWAPIV